MQDGVTVDVVVTDRHLSGRGRTTLLQLEWSPRDPLAVHLRLTATPDHPALPRGHWVVLRDFLQYGLEEPTGDGEVRICPVKGHARVRLDLRRDCGNCWVTVPVTVVRQFLDRTEELVPMGEERSAEALEELIARLLVD